MNHFSKKFIKKLTISFLIIDEFLIFLKIFHYNPISSEQNGNQIKSSLIRKERNGFINL
jgi:hypothetical protein